MQPGLLRPGADRLGRHRPPGPEAEERSTDGGAVYPEGSNSGGEDSGELWAYGISPQMKLIKAGQPDEYVRLFTEGYGIDNGGGILNLNTFTSSSENPFRVFKEIAGEQIIFCKKINGTDFFTRGNLDLVVIPDVIVSAALKLANQVQDLSGEKSASQE